MRVGNFCRAVLMLATRRQDPDVHIVPTALMREAPHTFTAIL